jgi:hypothetical protein
MNNDTTTSVTDVVLLADTRVRLWVLVEQIASVNL